MVTLVSIRDLTTPQKYRFCDADLLTNPSYQRACAQGRELRVVERRGVHSAAAVALARARRLLPEEALQLGQGWVQG